MFGTRKATTPQNAVAMREAHEESGLSRLQLVRPGIFDVDRHWIPARKTDPGHYHYDLRFLVTADPGEPLQISSESKDLGWVDRDRVVQLNPEESMARMVRASSPSSARRWLMFCTKLVAPSASDLSNSS